MGKWIAFVQIESFYIKAHRPPLWSGLRPMVVTRGSQVLQACRQAQAEGVNTGMPLPQVRCLCPQVQIITFNPDDCWPLYQQIWDVVAEHSPVVEPTGFHEGFAHITKVVSDTHQAKEWRGQVSKQIQQQTDLKSLVGVGPSKFVARVAASRNAVVAEEDVREFLAPISLPELGWLDSKLQDTLQRLGLTTLGQVVEVDKNTILQQAGLPGKQLHDWINGKDDQLVQPLYPPLEERVVHVFDIEDRQEVIIRALSQLCQQLAGKLQDTGRQARRLTLRLEDATDHHTRTQQYSRPLKEAPRVYQAAERLLKQLWEGQPLVSIELVAEGLQRVDHCQLGLWARRRHGAIEQAVEAARSRYGAEAVNRASQLKDKRRFAQMILGAKGRFSW